MNLGFMEIALIAGIALLMFGPSRLPGLGKSLGETIRGFKKAMDGSDENSQPPQQQARNEQLREHTNDQHTTNSTRDRSNSGNGSDHT